MKTPKYLPPRMIRALHCVVDRHRRERIIDVAARLCLALSVVLPAQFFSSFSVQPAWATAVVPPDVEDTPAPCTDCEICCPPLGAPASGGSKCPPGKRCSAPAGSPPKPTVEQGGGNGSVNCFRSPCNKGMPGPRPAATGNPIHLYRGAVIEHVTDVALPGPVFGWSHHRTYDSMLLNISGGELESGIAASGIRWQGGGIGPFLAEDGNDSGIDMYVDAHSRRAFEDPQEDMGTRITSYTAPADYIATLEKESKQDT